MKGVFAEHILLSFCLTHSKKILHYGNDLLLLIGQEEQCYIDNPTQSGTEAKF